MNKPKAIIIDIDGVLVRNDYIVPHNEFNWDEFIKADKESQYKLEPFVSLVRWFIQEQEYMPIFITARSVKMKPQTLNLLWGLFNKIYQCCLLMASEQEAAEQEAATPDTYHLIQSLQKEKFMLDNKLLDEYDIVLAIDDHEENCLMYQKYGISTLKPTYVGK